MHSLHCPAAKNDQSKVSQNPVLGLEAALQLAIIAKAHSLQQDKGGQVHFHVRIRCCCCSGNSNQIVLLLMQFSTLSPLVICVKLTHVSCRAGPRNSAQLSSGSHQIRLGSAAVDGAGAHKQQCHSDIKDASTEPAVALATGMIALSRLDLDFPTWSVLRLSTN